MEAVDASPPARDSRAQVAATPTDGWGPSGGRYPRLVFANEPAERLTDLRARFDTALS